MDTSDTIRPIIRLSYRFCSGSGRGVDGEQRNFAHCDVQKAIEEADHWALTDCGHQDYVGGYYEVWAEYSEDDSDLIHVTATITA